MLKKLSLIAAALLAGALAFADPLSADGGASPANAGSVNAEWKWNKIPKSKIGTESFSYRKPVVLEPTLEGSKGASFQLDSGETKFKQESYVALYHNNKDSARLENIVKNKKAVYSITIDDAATITLTVAGNGSASASRIVCLVKDEPELADPVTPILFADQLDGDAAPIEITYKNAPAGTYKILVNGSRIVSVSAKN